MNCGFSKDALTALRWRFFDRPASASESLGGGRGPVFFDAGRRTPMDLPRPQAGPASRDRSSASWRSTPPTAPREEAALARRLPDACRASTAAGSRPALRLGLPRGVRHRPDARGWPWTGASGWSAPGSTAAARRLRLYRGRRPRRDLSPGDARHPRAARRPARRSRPTRSTGSSSPAWRSTPRCYRLGRGRGITTGSCRPSAPTPRAGRLAFDCQWVDDLPVEPHDVPLDGVVSPTREVNPVAGAMSDLSRKDPSRGRRGRP